MNDTAGEFLSRLRNSGTIALLGIGLLALVLQIPISMISGLINERQARRSAAAEEIGAKWGRAQTITGPVLVVPFTHRVSAVAANGTDTTRLVADTAVFLPDTLQVNGRLASEKRSRGIFTVPVYHLDLAMKAVFKAPEFSDLGIHPVEIAWDRAALVLGASDVRAITRQPIATWKGGQSSFVPGTAGFKVDSQEITDGHAGVTPIEGGIHAPLPFDPRPERMTVDIPLKLNGSSDLSFAPFGRETLVHIEGNSIDPSFQGNWLPNDRALTPKGFTADWNIPYLGRGYPQAWTVGSNPGSAIRASRFGVALVDPVDHYRMADRSVKYAFLFIILTFTAVWLIEVLAGVRVHPIQYLLIGAALCLFYLLELSLAEHLGFPVAFAIASSAVVVMIGCYGRAILLKTAHALWVAGGIAALYGFLYVLLTNEDNALLLGSIGLFFAVALVMYLTRRVNWYAVRRPLPGATA